MLTERITVCSSEADAFGEGRPATVEGRARVTARRWLALLILCLGDLKIVLDVTIGGVALMWIRCGSRFLGRIARVGRQAPAEVPCR